MILIKKRSGSRGGSGEPGESQDRLDVMPNKLTRGVDMLVVPRGALSQIEPKTGGSVDEKGMVGWDRFYEIGGMPLVSPVLAP